MNFLIYILFYTKIKSLMIKFKYIFKLIIGDWGLGIGDWGLGVWGLGPTPKTPNPKPKTPKPTTKIIKKKKFFI